MHLARARAHTHVYMRPSLLSLHAHASTYKSRVHVDVTRARELEQGELRRDLLV